MKGQDEKAIKILTRVNGETNAGNEYDEIKKSILSKNKMTIPAQLRKLFTKNEAYTYHWFWTGYSSAVLGYQCNTVLCTHGI